jgi:GNAT superfamily N-acetyltransferase
VNELEDVAEWIEAAAVDSWYGAGASVGIPVKTARDGNVLAACFEGSNDKMTNRVFGLGLGLAATLEGIDVLGEWFRAHRAERYLVHASPSARPAELGDWLLGRGLRRHRSWMKFARGRDAVARPSSSLAVRRAGPELGDVFAEISIEAFGLPAEARALLSMLPTCSGWHAFVSFHGETPAGAGALFVSGDVGWLGFGATKSEFRGRGGQAAVMAARLETALEAGCRIIVTETGEAAPGDKQHSYKNILRAGFRELYLRENYAAGS